MIYGEKIILRAVKSSDFKYFKLWANDNDVNIYRRRFLPVSETEIKDSLSRRARDKSRAWFAIVDRKSNDVLGDICLTDINWITKGAWAEITIGNKSYWNKGIGTESMDLLLGYAFNKLDLHKIKLEVMADNIGGVMSYIKSGFIIEGYERDEEYKNRAFHSVLLMAIINPNH